MPLSKRLTAEFIGTLWLVLGGCGAAVLATRYPGSGIGFAGVSLAFGLTVVAMAYAVGHMSGGHFNPAVTVGLAMGKRFAWKDVPAYVVTQVVAAIAAAAVLFVVANGQKGFSASATGFATNGYGSRSPGAQSPRRTCVLSCAAICRCGNSAAPGLICTPASSYH